jgi:uncharacterized membrane protein YkoI
MLSIMRLLAIITVALVLALCPPVLAKSDKAQNAAPGQSENGKTGDKPDPPGQVKKDEPGSGQEGASSLASPPAAAKPPGSAKGLISIELDEVQRAVRSREALPLARIIAVAEERATGHVINAKLVRIDGTLLYQLTLLSETGQSWREYYYARTGNPVVIR